jgi:pimeloyl-ACP methyl ester carboxylesterase
MSGLSPRRRLLVISAVLLVALPVAVSVLLLLRRDQPRQVPAQDQPGPVLLVPGFGGDAGGVTVLAERIRAIGREAIVVTLPADGTGDLREQAEVLDGYVATELQQGALSVDVIGYSAGGVVARVWAQDHDGAHKARRIVTLGSPHSGTELAAAGAVAAPGVCPVACQQLAPGSRLLAGLDTPVRTPPSWLSLWTVQDQTVTPPDSARLDGAVNVALQSVCPDLRVDHSGLPRDPFVTKVVLAAIGATPLRAPTRGDCVSS